MGRTPSNPTAREDPIELTPSRTPPDLCPHPAPRHTPGVGAVEKYRRACRRIGRPVFNCIIETAAVFVIAEPAVDIAVNINADIQRRAVLVERTGQYLSAVVGNGGKKRAGVYGAAVDDFIRYRGGTCMMFFRRKRESEADISLKFPPIIMFSHMMLLTIPALLLSRYTAAPDEVARFPDMVS